MQSDNPRDKNKTKYTGPNGEQSERILKTRTEIEMAITILTVEQQKTPLNQKPTLIFKKEIYSAGFHPQVVSDFLENLLAKHIVACAYDSPRKKFGGPVFWVTDTGREDLRKELRSLLDRIKTLFV